MFSPTAPRRLPTGLAAILTTALTLAGCATTESRISEEHRTPLAEPFDMAWAELENVYRTLDLPIAELPVREPVIRTGDVPLDAHGVAPEAAGKLVDCPGYEGEPGPGSERGAFLRVTTRLEQKGSAADVITEIDAWRTTDRGHRRTCRSTGVLERRIADELKARV
jgi:hypothetical protein